jgi:hypothetical protein
MIRVVGLGKIGIIFSGNRRRFFFSPKNLSLGMVAHTCNPSPTGSLGRKVVILRQLAQKMQNPI